MSLDRVQSASEPRSSGGGIELPIPLSRGFSISAWLTLFRISVRQFVRGRRLLVLAAIYVFDVIDTLISKNVINITDLPVEAQTKLFGRKGYRERATKDALKLFGDDDGRPI